jgi:hypothetical protein
MYFYPHKVNLYLGDILEAKKYLGACFPHISKLIDDNPTIAHGTYEYLLTSLQEYFDGNDLFALLYIQINWVYRIEGFLIYVVQVKNLFCPLILSIIWRL